MLHHNNAVYVSHFRYKYNLLFFFLYFLCRLDAHNGYLKKIYFLGIIIAILDERKMNFQGFPLAILRLLE